MDRLPTDKLVALRLAAEARVKRDVHYIEPRRPSIEPPPVASSRTLDNTGIVLFLSATAARSRASSTIETICTGRGRRRRVALAVAGLVGVSSDGYFFRSSNSIRTMRLLSLSGEELSRELDDACSWLASLPLDVETRTMVDRILAANDADLTELAEKTGRP